MFKLVGGDYFFHHHALDAAELINFLAQLGPIKIGLHSFNIQSGLGIILGLCFSGLFTNYVLLINFPVSFAAVSFNNFHLRFFNHLVLALLYISSPKGFIVSKFFTLPPF